MNAISHSKLQPLLEILERIGCNTDPVIPASQCKFSEHIYSAVFPRIREPFEGSAIQRLLDYVEGECIPMANNQIIACGDIVDYCLSAGISVSIRDFGDLSPEATKACASFFNAIREDICDCNKQEAAGRLFFEAQATRSFEEAGLICGSLGQFYRPDHIAN